jgi:Glycosyltransferase (GlcNAc)
MYRAVQLCAPKTVLSTYPSAIAEPYAELPEVLTAQRTVQRGGRRLAAMSPAALRAATPPLPWVVSRHLSAEATAKQHSVNLDCRNDSRSSSDSSSFQTAAAPQAGTPQLRSARALTSDPEEVPIIRICTGDFSGGPNKRVFRFAGQPFSPRGRAVRVPFAAGMTCMPTQQMHFPHTHRSAWGGSMDALAGSDLRLDSAAGFMFASGLVLDEVPFDPELPFLFDGEEVGNCGDRWASRSSELVNLICSVRMTAS